MTADKTHLEFPLFLRHNIKVRSHGVTCRQYSSVATVLKGDLTYTYKDGSFKLNEGESVFLPYNSSYTYKSDEGECILLQIVFNICFFTFFAKKCAIVCFI